MTERKKSELQILVQDMQALSDIQRLGNMVVHTAVQAPLGQIEGDPGAADDEQAADPLLHHAQILHQTGQVLDAGGDEDGVPLLKGERIARVASYPSIPGILISIRTAS